MQEIYIFFPHKEQSKMFLGHAYFEVQCILKISFSLRKITFKTIQEGLLIRFYKTWRILSYINIYPSICPSALESPLLGIGLPYSVPPRPVLCRLNPAVYNNGLQ